jgi:multisubunit Na+/H+ antiporter MnhG subunit
MRRLAEKDPADRQVAFLAIGAYSGCLFGTIAAFAALASQGKVMLGVVTAVLILVVDLPVSFLLVRAARRKQAQRRSGSTAQVGHFSRRV